MVIISRNPHSFNTKIHAVLTYRNINCSVDFICRKYHCSRASLMRWNKRFDGSDESLVDKSHRPHSMHPKAHTPEEIAKIKNLVRRNPHIGLNETFGGWFDNDSFSGSPISTIEKGSFGNVTLYAKWTPNA